ncbi:winged helix-turn-helix transcriptional regulator [Ochrobactrum sp. Q0168]|uniref:MarR family winged helix-turn-helix transcriptional regulator n=1 Tax=Ochrobactrum sp. Q0168 TaxID=2793241 RepID=UPI0018EBCB3C|nr:winged helix-turn-helix transcriptional regulator [Ochrobactrum sp. Q0168]
MSEEFDLDAFLPYQISAAAARISRDFAVLYEKTFGLAPTEWRVLAHLSQQDEVSIRDIHFRIDMDKSKASRAASRLEDIGLVAKVLNPDDRRLVCLSLTEEGREMVKQITPIANAFQSELSELIGKDMDSFQRSLKKILNR